MVKLLFAPASGSAGCAVTLEIVRACAEAGIARAARAAVSITTRVNRLRPLAALWVFDVGLIPSSGRSCPRKIE